MIVDTTVDKKQINKNVRTLAKNNKNLSPLISTAGKIILEQCLEQHAENIVKEL